MIMICACNCADLDFFSFSTTKISSVKHEILFFCHFHKSITFPKEHNYGTQPTSCYISHSRHGDIYMFHSPSLKKSIQHVIMQDS